MCEGNVLGALEINKHIPKCVKEMFLELLKSIKVGLNVYGIPELYHDLNVDFYIKSAMIQLERVISLQKNLMTCTNEITEHHWHICIFTRKYHSAITIKQF